MAAVQSAPKFPDICPQEIYGGKYVDRSPNLRPVSLRKDSKLYLKHNTDQHYNMHTVQ